MTDKQIIIIDDVNVAECKHLYREIDCLAHIDFSECCEGYNPSYGYCPNIDCYYKQLKAKEQECERLKEMLKDKTEEYNKLAVNYDAYVSMANKQLDLLKAENDKYSLFIEKLCDYAGLECDSEEQAMRTLSDLASQMNKARWIIDRYKQNLTEIKEIAEMQCVCGVNCQDMKIIRQKISECEETDVR